ncbi:MAG: hypothetical protein WCF26_02685 [Candidatus Sulfotelmatobacter sp.]
MELIGLGKASLPSCGLFGTGRRQLAAQNIHPSRYGNVPITDTSPSAQALQLQIQRAMPGEQRLFLALEMSLFARELAKEQIRREYPEWSDAQVARELVRLTFMPALVPARLR